MSDEIEKIRTLCRKLVRSTSRIGASRRCERLAREPDDGPQDLWANGFADTSCSQDWDRIVEPLFGALDGFIRSASDRLVSAARSDRELQALLPSLHRVRAVYEFDKETVLARTLVGARDGRERLADLLEREAYWALGPQLRGALESAEHVAVVGSGPLPLTALSIAARLGCRVTAIERDVEAQALGRRVLGLSDAAATIACANSDIAELAHLDDFDAIVCAVLTGVDMAGTGHRSKASITQRLLDDSAPGTRIVLREPNGLGFLIYPPAELDGLPGIAAERFMPPLRPDEPYCSGFIFASKSNPRVRHDAAASAVRLYP